jgi:chromosome segregation ATPase
MTDLQSVAVRALLLGIAEAQVQALTAERDKRATMAADRDTVLSESNIEWAIQRVRQKDALHKEVIDIERICRSHEVLREQVADIEQQLNVLKPGGTYAWKCRAEKAEADLATARAERDAALSTEAACKQEVLRLNEALTHAMQTIGTLEGTLAAIRAECEAHEQSYSVLTTVLALLNAPPSPEQAGAR